MEIPIYPNYIEESKLVNDFLVKNPQKKILTVERILKGDNKKFQRTLTELLDFLEIDGIAEKIMAVRPITGGTLMEREEKTPEELPEYVEDGMGLRYLTEDAEVVYIYKLKA